jgi:16S rRNA (guanine1207-N2)-methyltransferase
LWFLQKRRILPLMKNKNNALDTLFYPFEKGLLPWPAAGSAVLFLNAQNHSALSNLNAATLQQTFKPYSVHLPNAVQNIPSEAGAMNMALIALPKNHVEAQYLIARALIALKDDGQLIIAADNKAGAGRIAKKLQNFGLNSDANESKNKARVYWTTKTDINQDAIDISVRAGQPKTILDGVYQSHPGIYGWDKVDKGSAILAATFPEDLKGHGADFGCGYGYLSIEAIKNCTKIKSLTLIDADHRALECAKLNVANTEVQTQFLWEDLTTPVPSIKNMDFILMNPPFHEGKMADSAIGIAFIKSAYAALRRNGSLYMVANNQLPYEPILEELFFKTEKIHEGQGFKAFRATK